MQAPEHILNVWNKFNHFPMETLTKVWYRKQNPEKHQRTVEQMKVHFQQYHIAGNCFDLAIWMLDEYKQQNITAYAIGHDLFTEHAHVAVIAVDNHQHRYLCDLGDQWIQPICVDQNSPHFRLEDCVGFFPGATVQVHPINEEIEILYKRPNGKVSRQRYSLNPIDEQTLWEAAEFSQRLIKPEPLVECRQYGEEVTHWEFDNWNSFTSTMNGLTFDEKLDSIHEWVERIHNKTGYAKEVIQSALEHYSMTKEKI